MNIAIVGFGVGGANILKNIINHENYYDEIKIHIFEKREELATGLAYEIDTNYKVLNVDEKYMSIDLNDSDHFVKWLKENKKENEKIDGMIPRVLYGQYIKENFQKYIENENVKVNKSEVTDIYKLANKFKIKSHKHVYKEEFDYIFLAIGQSNYKDTYNLKSNANYIHNLFPLEEKIGQIEEEKIIGIIGTGPSSIDIYRYIRKFKKTKEPIYFFTKEKYFPPIDLSHLSPNNICSINENWINKNKDDQGFVSLEKITQQISKDFEEYGYNLIDVYRKYKDTDINKYRMALKNEDVSLGFVQTYTMELTGHAACIYNSLNSLDKAKVDSDYLGMIDFIVTKTPTTTTENIISDYDSAKIKLVRGTKNIRVNDGSFIIQSELEDDIKTDIVINAQGFEKNLLSATKNDKLLANLYKRRFIEEDVDGKFIRVTYPSYNLINKKYGLMENIYLNGMWAGSTDILNNDLRSIIRSSQMAAMDLMNKIQK